MTAIDPNSIKILLVDDMPNSRQVLREMLMASGFQHLSEATNGSQALEMLRSGQFSLVISDWYMPMMAGVDLVREIRKDGNLQQLPFIMVTSVSDRENLVEALKSGVSDYIVKPCSQDLIERKVNGVLVRSHNYQVKTPEEYKEIHNAFTTTRESLKLSKIAIEQASDAKDRVIDIMTNELPKPVNVVMGILQNLLQKEKTEEDRKLLAVAFDASNQLMTMVNDFIDLTQLETGSRRGSLGGKRVKSGDGVNDGQIRPLRVLVVDDVMLNRTLVEGLLKPKGHKLSFATNGAEALSIIEQSGYFNKSPRPFDLILMDMQMPVMDGVEATKKIREREAAFAGVAGGGKGMPIVGLSVHSYQEAVSMVAEAGMDEYLMKPVNPVRLAEVMRTISKSMGEKGEEAGSSAASLPMATAKQDETASVLRSRIGKSVQSLDGEVADLKLSDSAPLLDWEQLFEIHNGNEKIIRSLFSCFIEEIEILSDQLMDCYSPVSLADLRLPAHAINGSAANVSALCLQALAANLEKASAASPSGTGVVDEDAVGKLFPMLLKVIDLTSRAVREALAE